MYLLNASLLPVVACIGIAAANPLLQQHHVASLDAALQHPERRNPPSASEQLQSIMTAHSLPALAVSYNDGTDLGLKKAARGVRRLGDPTPVTDTDTWHLGSNTKAMTATTIALLIQDGLLAWNTTLQEIFAVYKATVAAPFANVTVADLATHRSGITGTAGVDNPPLLPSQQLELYELDAATGRAIVVSAVLALPTTGVRGAYQYSNNNYIVLGLIIDAVAGQAAEKVIARRLWEPLQLASAGWGANPESTAAGAGAGAAPENPWPHLVNLTTLATYPYREEWPVVFRDYAPYMNTAGRAHMSLGDYDKWLRLHVDPEAQAAVGLGREQLEILHTAYRGDDDGEDTLAYTYGGWSQVLEGCEGAEQDGVCLVHAGSNTMNVALAWVDTGRNVTVSAATNAPYIGGGPGGTELAVALLLNGTILL